VSPYNSRVLFATDTEGIWWLIVWLCVYCLSWEPGIRLQEMCENLK
jgi:hypothetical protein